MLELRGIRAGYGRLPVLFDIDLAVEAGEWLTVVGANGAGRSTLLKTVLGVTNVTAGEVHFGGERVTHLSSQGRISRGVAMVPEGRRIFPNLSVKENLVMAARNVPTSSRGWSFGRVMETFPRLSERLGHLGGQLSGGEQQMLSIGRALMTQPELIILDEATEGLAPLIVAEIWRVIEEIRRDGIATLIVDRDYRKVLANCDQALVLQKGQAVLEGNAQELEKHAELAGYLGL